MMTQEQQSIYESLKGLGFVDDSFQAGDCLHDIVEGTRGKLNTELCELELVECTRKDGTKFLIAKIIIGEQKLKGGFRGSKRYGTPMIGCADGNFKNTEGKLEHYHKGVVWFE